MQRFFVSPSAIADRQVHFTAEQARQLRLVLRLSAGDEVEALDGRGASHRVVIERLGKNEAIGRILTTAAASGEPAGDIILCQALIRPQRFEWVLEKGTELGVTHFQPIITARTRRQDVSDVRRERWQRIVQEAAEQSGRGRLPELLSPLPLAEAFAGRRGFALFPTLSATRPARQALAEASWPVTLFIGPEGGFDPAEEAMARTTGITAVTLGPRTLRAETAAVALIALTVAALGELDRPALPSSDGHVTPRPLPSIQP